MNISITLFSVEAIIFTKDLKDIKLTRGGVKNVTLECEISKPGLRLDWYLGNKKLRRGDKYDIIADGTVHKLLLEQVEEELAGEYRAVYESLETKGNLSIESKCMVALVPLNVVDYLQINV